MAGIELLEEQPVLTPGEAIERMFAYAARRARGRGRQVSAPAPCGSPPWG